MKALLPLLLCAASLTACAEAPDAAGTAADASGAGAVGGLAPPPAAGSADERALEALHSINPSIEVDHLGPAPLPGFREAVVGGQMVYISDDGRYLLQGALFDVREKADLSQAGMADVRRRLLATIPAYPSPRERRKQYFDIGIGTMLVTAVLLLYLLRDRYSRAVKTANWAYYEPRTAHDSSLSPMAYALVAADVGMTGWAHTYFMQTALLDLLGTGPHWNLGVHTAAMGGAWLAVVHGFCQLDLREDGVHLLGWPHLPAGWRRVGFRVVWHGQRVGFSTDGVTTSLETLDGPVPATYPGGVVTLMPGQPLRLRGDAPPAQ